MLRTASLKYVKRGRLRHLDLGLEGRSYAAGAPARRRPANAPASNVAIYLESLRKRTPHGSKSSTRRARIVYDDLQELSARHDDYALAAAALTKGGDWREAVSLMDLAQQASIQPGFASRSTLVAALESGHHWAAALDIVHDMQKQSPLMTPAGYRAAVAANLRAGRKAEAEQLFENMMVKGRPQNLSGYNKLLSTCAKLQRWKEAGHLFEVMQDALIFPDVISWNTLVSACGAAAEWQRTLRLLKEMALQWSNPDDASFGSALAAVAKSHCWEQVLQLLQTMAHAKVTPSPWGYSSAIHACLAGTIAATAESIGAGSYNVAGIPHAAWTLFCEAVEQNLVVPPGACAALISPAASAKQWQHILVIMEHMQHHGTVTKLTTEMKNIAARGCFEASRWHHAVELLQLSDLDDIGGFGILIHAEAAARHWKGALQAFEKLRGNGLIPTAAVCTTVLDLLGEVHRWEDAVQLLLWMQSEEPEHKQLRNSTFAHNAAIEACRRAQQGDAALEIWHSMPSRDVMPDVATHVLTVSAMQSSAAWSLALHIFMSMQERQLEAGVKAWPSLLSIPAEERPGEHAKQLLRTMHQWTQPPDVVAYTAAVNACRTDWQIAVDLLHMAQEEGLQPDIMLYESIRDACLSANQWMASLTLVLDMDAKGLRFK